MDYFFEKKEIINAKKNKTNFCINELTKAEMNKILAIEVSLLQNKQGKPLEEKNLIALAAKKLLKGEIDYLDVERTFSINGKKISERWNVKDLRIKRSLRSILEHYASGKRLELY